MRSDSGAGQFAGLHSLKLHNHVKERGRVTQSLKAGTVAICAVTGPFKVGSTVYLCGETYCLERRIVSLQLEDVAYEEVNLLSAAELGMMFDAPGKKNAIIMAFEFCARFPQHSEGVQASICCAALFQSDRRRRPAPVESDRSGSR